VEDFITIYGRNISSALELFQIFFNFSLRALRWYNQRKRKKSVRRAGGKLQVESCCSGNGDFARICSWCT